MHLAGLMEELNIQIFLELNLKDMEWGLMNLMHGELPELQTEMFLKNQEQHGERQEQQVYLQ